MRTTVIAEIGQNHQGSVEVAKDIVYRAAHPVDPDGDWSEHENYAADAVKFTKRDLSKELTRDAADAPYEGPQSFGETYMDHRRALELSWDEHTEIYEYARSQDMGYVITLCQPSLVDELPFAPDALKVASRDLSNLPLIDRISVTHLPIILSTGMADRRTLDAALEIIARYHGSLEHTTIMQCTSSYPCPFSEANLQTIPWIRENYPDATPGFSDHTEGVQAGAWAVLLGAEVVEVHVTPSRVLRGSDHRPALSIAHGLWRYCRNISHAEQALGRSGLHISPAARKAQRKLERSIAASSDLSAGTVLGSSNTELLSPGTGIPWTARSVVFGRQLTEDVEAKTLVSSTQLDAA